MSSWFKKTPEIDVAALQELRRSRSPHTVLDIRELDETEICAITPSLCIPMQEVPARLEELPHEQPLVVLCHFGARSARVTDFLRKSGFDNVHNLVGGIDAWAQQIDPAMQRY